MADIIFNIAKGRLAAYVDRVVSNDPANSALTVVILKTAAADAVLQDLDTLAAILAGASVEADFTNYVRKVLTDADLTAPAVDDANDRVDISIPQLTFTAAGGAVNNTTAKLLLCYDPDTTGGTDADLIPLAAYDYVETTSGSDLVINAGVVARAS